MFQPDSSPAKHNHLFSLPKTMISALLHKTCKEKQENKGNVQLNGFITETDSEHSETFEALTCSLSALVENSATIQYPLPLPPHCDMLRVRCNNTIATFTPRVHI